MAFTILANSTTADATEVMGNFYYIGAGNDLPYFQTTAGNLSAVHNTYDLGADTTAWRKLYTKQIGDATFGYSIEGASVTVNADITFKSACVMNIDCTITAKQIYNTDGIKHKQGPNVKTRYISIGSWDMSATNGVYVTLQTWLTTTMVIVESSAWINCDTDFGISVTSALAVQGSNIDSLFYGNCVLQWNGDTAVGLSVNPNIYLYRTSTSIFNSIYFNDAALNRGFIKIVYME